MARGLAQRCFMGCAILLALPTPNCGFKKKAKVNPVASAQPHAPLVASAIIESGSEQPLWLRGPVVAGSRLRLGFKAPGVLSTVLVKAGEPVKKGQLLASIDGADESSRSREAQIGRDRAQREYTRTKKLVDQGSLPPAAAATTRRASSTPPKRRSRRRSKRSGGRASSPRSTGPSSSGSPSRARRSIPARRSCSSTRRSTPWSSSASPCASSRGFTRASRRR